MTEGFLESFYLSDAPTKSQRVLVAMSGGVDSSVVAAGLKKVGYDVVGVTLLLYEQNREICGSRSCCGSQDIEDARRLAQQLDIPHYVLDRVDLFREEVMIPFAQSYWAGQTPLPCATCNRSVKFGALFSLMKELGASFLVSGHYVRHGTFEGMDVLYRGADPLKDQSYFLFSTPKETLPFLRFPLGNIDKETTRRWAAEQGLAVSSKPDSQGICFVPEGDYRPVIEEILSQTPIPGPLVHVDGTVLGQHKGIAFYTVGQRRGLDIGGLAEPLYVLGIIPQTHTVIVGPSAALEEKEVFGGSFHWLGAGDNLPSEGIWADVQIRYHHTPQRAFIQPVMETETQSVFGQTRFVFEHPVRGFAPGQALVAYAGDRLLGGAIGLENPRFRSFG